MSECGADGVDLRPMVVQTHVSDVFLVGDRVFKRKRPVRTGFLDFTTLEARRAACLREVELNRRLAPDVYLGVADIVLDGAPVDHAVVMRRLPAGRRLSTVANTPQGPAAVDAVAEVLAAFHATARRGPDIDASATPDALARLWARGWDELSAVARGALDAGDVARARRLGEAFLSRCSAAVQRRVEAGAACDGHGDLLADDIYCLDDGPRIIDCLEFDDLLRHGDVLLDVAFLAMDLEHQGHPEVAHRFLDSYRAASGDRWPDTLAHFFIAYRAHVRAKVACIRYVQGDAEAAVEAREVLQLCLRHLELAQPVAVLVGGAPGTGKTTVADALGRALGARILHSDEIRKERAGIAAHTPAPAPMGAGIYTRDETAAVYAELVRRAGAAIADGEPVVIDASWTSAAHRALAEGAGLDPVELRCDCDPALACERIRRRSLAGGDASDATPAVASAMRAAADPWPTAVTLDTDADVEPCLDHALAAVARWRSAKERPPISAVR